MKITIIIQKLAAFQRFVAFLRLIEGNKVFFLLSLIHPLCSAITDHILRFDILSTSVIVHIERYPRKGEYYSAHIGLGDVSHGEG